MIIPLRSSALKPFHLILIIGSVLLKCISAELTNNLVFNSFGYEFFTKYSSLNQNGDIGLQVNCSTQLEILENALKTKDIWALKFADAWAKIPSGILYGHQMDMGNYDECLSINENWDENLPIQGKYCLSKFELTEKQKENENNALLHTSLDLAVCFPTTCKTSEMEIMLNKFSEEIWKTASFNGIWTFSESRCTPTARDPLQVLDWVAISILILLGALLILSTCYDYFADKDKKSSNHLLTAFSISKNMGHLMHIMSAEETPKHVIPALNGIRCLSMIAIVFVHTYMMLILSPNVNNADIAMWQRTPFYMVWKNSVVAVDSFFFLSGLLLVSAAFREMEKNKGELNIGRMYFHRFFRLSPVLYFAVLIFMTLFRYAGNGPIWNQFSSSYHLCNDTWWATILYVQNYAAAGRMCLGHTWYLAVDTQLYILSPFVLILLWRWHRWGLAILLFIGLLLIVCLFAIIIINHLIVFSVNSELMSDSEGMRKTYYSTQSRALPWIISIIFGYFLHAHNNRRFVIPKFVVILGWFLAIILFLTVVFALYPETQTEAQSVSPLEGAFYLPLSRVAWPLGLCWLVFACVNGYAGFVNSFLSWFIWQPLSKLCYCMYILHSLVYTVNSSQIKTNSHFSNYDAFLRFWGDFGTTIIVSAIVYLSVEAPLLGIEKYLLTSKATKSEEDKQPANTISQQNLCD